VHKIPRYRLCFVCGRDNAASLDVQFFRDGPRIHCEWTPDPKHLGYPDRAHGGIVATILDEAMSWAPAADWKRMAYSIELTVKYRRPIPRGMKCRVEAEVVELKRRFARTTGRVLDVQGIVCAEANGLYFPLPDGKTEEILPELYIEDESRRVTLDDL